MYACRILDLRDALPHYSPMCILGGPENLARFRRRLDLGDRSLDWLSLKTTMDRSSALGMHDSDSSLQVHKCSCIYT